MSIAWKKRWMWALLYTCGAGTLFFFSICLMQGPPPTLKWWLWPITGLTGSLFAILCLRRYYREEPSPSTHRPQLSLIDLWVLVGMVGTMMALWKAVGNNPAYEMRGLIACGLSALPLLGGVLTAVKRGMTGFFPRWIFAIGYALKIAGGLGVGALVMLVICISIGAGESPFRLLGMFLFDQYGGDAMISFIRWSFLLLPAGIGLCSWAGRLNKSEPQPPVLP